VSDIEIFKLFGSILVDSSEADNSISKTEKNAEGFATKLGNGIKTAAKWGAAIGAGALVAGTAMLGLATKAGNTADRLLDLNSITGMSTDEIQKWERVTKVAGVNADAMTNASQKLTKSLDSMSNGTGKGIESVKKLGLSFDDISKMNADQRMDAITQALAGVEDKTERARLGTDLLGGSWKEIAPIVDLGAEAMQKAKDSADIVSNDNLVKANDFRIAMDVMKDRVNFLSMELGIKLIPIAEKLFEWVDDRMPQIQKIFDIGFTVISEVVGAAANVIEQYLIPFLQFLWSWIEKHLPEIQEIFFKVFSVIQEIISTFIQLTQTIWEKYGEDIKRITKMVFEAIKIVIDTTLKVIQGIITTVTGLMSGDWQKVWEGIATIVKTVLEGIAKLIPKLLEGLYNAMRLSFSVFKDIGKSMFNMVWEGMKGIWTSVSNWVGDKVSWLADKLMFWKKSSNEMNTSSSSSSSKGVNGSHANGLAYVPFDGYVAELHKGEKILTAEENKNGTGNINENVLASAIIKALIDAGITKPAVLSLDGKLVGKGLIDIIDNGLHNKTNTNDIGKGVFAW